MFMHVLNFKIALNNARNEFSQYNIILQSINNRQCSCVTRAPEGVTIAFSSFFKKIYIHDTI